MKNMGLCLSRQILLRKFIPSQITEMAPEDLVVDICEWHTFHFSFRSSER